MRLFILVAVSLSVGSLVAAAYSSKTVENFHAYANQASRTYAKGDTGDFSGWRECLETEDTEYVGLICEGIRTIEVHGGRLVDVDYFCEFRFLRVGSSKFRVETEMCQ